MAIKRIEIKDFLVFKGKHTFEFGLGINIFIGGNGTGKTTLLKCIDQTRENYNDKTSGFSFKLRDSATKNEKGSCRVEFEQITSFVYIPEKDILEHARGLLPFIEKKQSGFNDIYRNILIASQDVYTKEQTALQESITEKVGNIIGGYVYWDMHEGNFYVIKKDGTKIPFVNEASGYKRIGLFGLIVACGQLEPGSILLWDEPENSLNPELVPLLVDILLELANNGVQIFIATHDYRVARFFDVRENKEIFVTFHNLSRKPGGRIECYTSTKYLNLRENILEDTLADVYEAVIQDARRNLVRDNEDE